MSGDRLELGFSICPAQCWNWYHSREWSCARRKFKDSISREIDRGLKEKNGHIYQKVLQTILQEVQLLESVVGDTEDWLKMLEDDWNEESKQSENARVKSEEKPNEKTQEGTQNKNKGMSIEEKPKEMNYKCNGHEQINKGKCIWRLLRMPIESDMELDPQSFEMIVHTVKDLLESASLPCKNRMSDLTDDNEEKRLCISDRTNIFKSMDTALLTDDGSKYLLSLRQILFTVQELKKRTGNRNLWKKILEGDTSMKRFLRKLDPKSPYHVKRIDNETDKETFNVIRELIEDEFEGKNDIFDMIKQQKPTIISKVCSIM